jgi:hypothetical protein
MASNMADQLVKQLDLMMSLGYTIEDVYGLVIDRSSLS